MTSGFAVTHARTGGALTRPAETIGLATRGGGLDRSTVRLDRARNDRPPGNGAIRHKRRKKMTGGMSTQGLIPFARNKGQPGNGAVRRNGVENAKLREESR